MLVEVDAASLEWRTYVYLSQDPVALEELLNGYDIHKRNQEAFKLPERLIAKKFLFRAIYWGPAWSYANDPEFNHVSKRESFWQQVIDRFFEKYEQLYRTQVGYIREVYETGKLVVKQTGRTYVFNKYLDKKTGEFRYKESDITNYPNQGLGHDLMAIARVTAAKRLRKFPDVLLINSIHDSILIDAPDDKAKIVADIVVKAFDDIPLNFQRIFGREFNVPMKGEAKIGQNWKDMEKIS